MNVLLTQCPTRTCLRNKLRELTRAASAVVIHVDSGPFLTSYLCYLMFDLMPNSPVPISPSPTWAACLLWQISVDDYCGPPLYSNSNRLRSSASEVNIQIALIRQEKNADPTIQASNPRRTIRIDGSSRAEVSRGPSAVKQYKTPHCRSLKVRG